jgi:hypothetical protein
MKRFFYLIIASTILLTSCKKEELPQPRVEEVVIEDEIRIYGEWILIDAKMYVDISATGERIVYNHFGPNKNVSSLRYLGNPIYDIERIVKDSTTWMFTPPYMVPGDGEFILNGDIEDPYGFHVTKNNWTIIEHTTSGRTNSPTTIKLGGSARPIDADIISEEDGTAYFYIQQGTGSVNGYNCTYLSELKMRKIRNL